MGFIRYSSFCLLLLAFIVSSVSGAGFSFDGLGVKARGMGGAFRAVADDWSAAYYNPAGYNRIADNYISANLSIFNNRNSLVPNVALGDFHYSNGQEFYNTHEVMNIPQGSIQFRLPVWGETAFGLSIMQLYDQNQTWYMYYNDPAYRNDTGLAFPEKQYHNDLDVIDFQLTMAKGFMDDRLSVGIGLQLLRGDLVYNNLDLVANPFENANYQPFEIIPQWHSANGQGFGFGFKLGFLYEATDMLDLALVYQSGASIDLDGSFEVKTYFADNPTATVVTGSDEYYFFSGIETDQLLDFKTTLDLPSTIGVGISYDMNDKLTLALDAEYVYWSAFEGFEFDISDDSGFIVTLTTPSKWDDGGRAMLGADYKLNDFTDLRFGFGVDQTVVSAETLVPQFMDLGTKYTYSLGIGFEVDFWHLELATSYTHQGDLKSPNYSNDYDGDGLLDNIAGDYKADKYQTVLGISYRF